jgi:hypothetical protein
MNHTHVLSNEGSASYCRDAFDRVSTVRYELILLNRHYTPHPDPHKDREVFH